MLRISENLTGDRIVAFRLEGRLVGPWVEELRRACESVLHQGGTLRLELTEVNYVDAPGLTLLFSLRERGVDLIGTRLFVHEQLKSRPT